MGGWIKLHRNIINNPIWKNDKFSRGQAFIDLLIRANHEDNIVIQDDKPELVERGALITSMRILAITWGWDRRTIRTFLKKLQAENMIFLEIIDKKKTKIKILNYDKYQSTETVEAHINNKFEKKNNKYNNSNIPAPGAKLNRV